MILLTPRSPQSIIRHGVRPRQFTRVQAISAKMASKNALTRDFGHPFFALSLSTHRLRRRLTPFGTGQTATGTTVMTWRSREALHRMGKALKSLWTRTNAGKGWRGALHQLGGITGGLTGPPVSHGTVAARRSGERHAERSVTTFAHGVSKSVRIIRGTLFRGSTGLVPCCPGHSYGSPAR
jgi:hypothetical protein